MSHKFKPNSRPEKMYAIFQEHSIIRRRDLKKLMIENGMEYSVNIRNGTLNKLLRAKLIQKVDDYRGYRISKKPEEIKAYSDDQCIYSGNDFIKSLQFFGVLCKTSRKKITIFKEKNGTKKLLATFYPIT